MAENNYDIGELRSSLETIHRAVSELITGIEALLRQLPPEREAPRPLEAEQEFMEMDRKANEPIKDSDVVLKIMYRETDGYEIDKITNMTQEQALDLAYKLASLGENEWDGNIQDFMEENGAEYVPIIVKGGRNSGMPEFFDIAVDLKVGEVSLEKELSGIEYAASIVHRLEHGKSVFSPDERNLIVNYGYKLDNYGKTKELADMLAYRIENEPVNAALTVIDAQAEIDALPDGMIGLSEMHGYGYTWEEMLPLTKETALELFDHDLPVYLLYEDGSEAMAEDRKRITEHKGIFGIEKGDWENERELRSMQTELTDEEIEYKDIEQARAAEEQEEEIAGNVTSGHDVPKSEMEQTETEQPEPEKTSKTPEAADMEEDEMIDLGSEREQVLSEMKKFLAGEQENELAFQIADRYISIQETDSGYDYSIMGADYKEIDGGVYDNPDVSIREALNDIVEDLKDNPFDNGARGNIGDNDELIPIDYDGLMEKVEAANRIEPQTQGNVVENFKAKTNELFHEISEMNPAEIEETVKCHVQAQLDEYGIDAVIVDAVVSGSRCRGLEREGSDLDVVVELSTNEREDVLFDMFNENGLHIGGVKVDINPITAQRTGSLETYLPKVEEYLEGVREAREKEPISIFNIRMNDDERWFKNTSGLDVEGLCKAYGECELPFVEMGKYGSWIDIGEFAAIQQSEHLAFSVEFNEETDEITIFDGENFEHKRLRATLFPEQAETEVTLTVAECGEFHNMGEFYENIPTVEEAVAIWKQIPPERMNGIPAIGINIHTRGTEAFEDVGIDILSGKRIDLDFLEYTPDIKDNPQAMDVIAELVAKAMPLMSEMEIDGHMSEEFEAKVWEKRMPDLTSAEQLAVEIDRFVYDYDTALYHDNSQSMTENVSEIAEALKQGDTRGIAMWLADVYTEGTEPEQKKAIEILKKLTEYKSLAKIEDNALNGMEEQNYNMVDNMLGTGYSSFNNGAGEKAQKEGYAAKISLKTRLAEKKEFVSGQGKDHEAQETMKKKQREV